MRVAVIGGGTAGVAAAGEAAGLGAAVSLYESADALHSPRGSWPSILTGAATGNGAGEERLRAASVRLELGRAVGKVEPDGCVLSGGVRGRFDSVVLATGSAPLREEIEGGARRGVHLLVREEDFLALREARASYGTAAVYGSGLASAEVADRLRSLGTGVTLFSPGGLLSARLDEGPRRLLLSAAGACGVRIVGARPERVVGVDGVEAVIAGGSVVPCEALAVVPASAPALPEAGVRRGRSGGVVVTERMLSSQDGVYAAGSCAEARVGSTTMRLSSDSSAESSGRVAGANAAGRGASTKVVGSFFRSLFGLEVASAGVGALEASAAGIDAVEHSKEWDEGLSCSLVTERGSGRVVGAQLAGRRVARFAAVLPAWVSGNARLADLAYAESLYSSDISPIAETAREALKKR